MVQVPRSRTGSLDVDTLDAFDLLVAGGAHSMRGWRLHALDLRRRDDTLARLDPAGAVLLGCRVTDASNRALRTRGALLFPPIHAVPFDPYRSRLYTAAELYAGVTTGSYEDTLDARVYAWATVADTVHDLPASLAVALHDHAIAAALAEELSTGALAGGPVVGIMGGHAVHRGDAAYTDAARLGRRLARAGLVVATGGGPGAMEAGNLGAYLADSPDTALGAAVNTLARTDLEPDGVTAWARAAFDVLGEHPGGRASLGIPTWFYGHEPPGPFATHIAKYFANAARESVLLNVCTGGTVFLPGMAGTVQEIFQEACENYYAAEQQVAPMVLVGREHWENELPAWPLLRALAADRPMRARVHLVDDVDEAYVVLAGA
ncbi:MAG: LOG family protein [Mycobacteriales bacterium]